MKLIKVTPTGKNSEIEALSSVFDAEVNLQLLAQSIRIYQSNQRQGAGRAQTRADVSLTKAKWYRQKGTGRARHGAKSAPIFVGGGVAHGPKGNTNWSRTITKKQKKVALISALSFCKQNIVVSDIPFETSGKTKYAAHFIHSIGASDQRCLLVLSEPDVMVQRAFNNLDNVVVSQATQLTPYHLLLADKIIITTKTLASIQKSLAGDSSVDTEKSDNSKSNSLKPNSLKKIKEKKEIGRTVDDKAVDEKNLKVEVKVDKKVKVVKKVERKSE